LSRDGQLWNAINIAFLARAAPRVGNVFHTAEKCFNLVYSRSVGYDDAIARKKISHCWNALGLRWLERQADYLLPPMWDLASRRSLLRFYRHYDDWWRNWFYLGIDIPPLSFPAPNGELSKRRSGGKVDAAEFLSAVGTFLAACGGFCIGQCDSVSWKIRTSFGQ